MGRKLDALLRRNFRASKFKSLANLAMSRASILKNQRHSRFSNARSDVIQLLNLGHQERALMRVEHVIKEQNMMDALEMIDNYCYLLIDKAVILKNSSRECPEELKEAISSLIFASSRCGEFPELQEIRQMFTSWFGKEFVSRAVELRNCCGVNPKMLQKLSTRQEGLERRQTVLKQLAVENGFKLLFEDEISLICEEKNEEERQQQQQQLLLLDSKPAADTCEKKEVFESKKSRRKYKDVVDAAQDAFESAAHAAAAARAVLELSLTGSMDDEDSDDHHSPDGSRHQQVQEIELQIISVDDTDSEDIKQLEGGDGSKESTHDDNPTDSALDLKQMGNNS